ncbi:Histone H1.2 [Striga hermonthica]|uniref:Histone H1.2 n=1 Tax=Striga hermonthica TaxID=68872 RepID=A0A9N7NMR7_STRHE|nr:Histone H1.2 [Striga hermonthica]
MASSHPPYFHMISEAITTLKDRTGSSQPAIAKFVEDNYEKSLPTNFRKIMSVQLKRLVRLEKISKVKSSYKIPATSKTSIPHKKTVTAAGKSAAEKAKKKKTKRLSEVKTPEAVKKKNHDSGKEEVGPMARAGSTPATKKGKKKK